MIPPVHNANEPEYLNLAIPEPPLPLIEDSPPAPPPPPPVFEVPNEAFPPPYPPLPPPPIPPLPVYCAKYSTVAPPPPPA